MTSMALRKFQQTALRHELLTETKERELAERYAATKDPAAASAIVAANQRLVWSIVSGFLRTHIHPMDLVQEGNLGLLVAVEKFDAARGVRFATHATWWIRDAILKFLRRNRSRSETATQAGELCGAPSECADPNAALTEAPTVEEQLAQRQIQQRVRILISRFANNLQGRDLDVFRSRYLAAKREHRAAIASRHNISGQRVSQIEAGLIGQLRSLLSAEIGEDAALAAV